MIPIYAAQPDRAAARRRRPPAPALVLGKPKRTILLLLARYVFLRADQICAAAFGRSHAFVQAHLRELTAAGWLLRAPYLRDSDLGKAPYVYTLAAPAWDWIGQQGLPVPERFRPSEEIGKVSPHTMEIAAFGVALERFCRRSAVLRIAQFRHERVLPATPIRLADGSTPRVRPDAWVQLAIERPEGIKQRCWVLEIDRASEYQVAFREKIRRLLAYRKEPYRQQFGTESIAILFTVPTAHRRDLVRGYIEAEIAAHERTTGTKVRPDLFWITDADPREADTDLFLAPCWVQPFRGATAALLAPSGPAGEREHAFTPGFLGEHGMLRFYQSLGERPPATSLETGIEEIV
jgi:hypothetical protein